MSRDSTRSSRGMIPAHTMETASIRSILSTEHNSRARREREAPLRSRLPASAVDLILPGLKPLPKTAPLGHEQHQQISGPDNGVSKREHFVTFQDRISDAGMTLDCFTEGHSTSTASPANRPVTASSTARKYQSKFPPPVNESSSPASFSTLIFAFRETNGLPTPARRFATRTA